MTLFWCSCDNATHVDRGLVYKLGARDLDLVKTCLNILLMIKSNMKQSRKKKTEQDIRDQELLIKLFEGYNVWMFM